MNINSSLLIGGNENHIQIKERQIYYKSYNITEDFVDLIRSGYLDNFIPPKKINSDKVTQN